ncbi:MAG TPA: arginase family protein [Roseiflexaceae bacterium]|nr:arginase family protein [Roseiflexaceae bacterium]
MNLTIIPVPYSLDVPDTGMGKAPEALLAAGLVGRLESAGCTVRAAQPVRIPASGEPREARLGQLLALLGREVARARAASAFPLVLGGDCLTALGTIAGLLDPADTAVAWLDAHGDFNTPAITVSGYLGGMPLACAVGRGLDELRAAAGLPAAVPEANVALIGARDLDPLEEAALAGSGVALVRGAELAGGARTLGRALGPLGELSQLYLHVDIDVLDPAEAPGVDYPAAGGLRLEELRAAVQRIAGMGNLAALALTAVNPEKDADGRTVRAALDVVEAAVAEAVNAQL